MYDYSSDEKAAPLAPGGSSNSSNGSSGSKGVVASVEEVLEELSLQMDPLEMVNREKEKRRKRRRSSLLLQKRRRSGAGSGSSSRRSSTAIAALDDDNFDPMANMPPLPNEERKGTTTPSGTTNAHTLQFLTIDSSEGEGSVGFSTLGPGFDTSTSMLPSPFPETTPSSSKEKKKKNDHQQLFLINPNPITTPPLLAPSSSQSSRETKNPITSRSQSMPTTPTGSSQKAPFSNSLTLSSAAPWTGATGRRHSYCKEENDLCKTFEKLHELGENMEAELKRESARTFKLRNSHGRLDYGSSSYRKPADCSYSGEHVSPSVSLLYKLPLFKSLVHIPTIHRQGIDPPTLPFGLRKLADSSRNYWQVVLPLSDDASVLVCRKKSSGKTYKYRFSTDPQKMEKANNDAYEGTLIEQKRGVYVLQLRNDQPVAIITIELEKIGIEVKGDYLASRVGSNTSFRGTTNRYLQPRSQLKSITGRTICEQRGNGQNSIIEFDYPLTIMLAFAVNVAVEANFIRS